MSQVPNPYEPNNPFTSTPNVGQQPPAPMSEKPASIMVFGILNLVFGVLGFCGLGMGAVGLFAAEMIPSDPNMPNPTMELLKESPAYWGFTVVTMGLGAIFIIVLIAGGVGLLQSKSFGRTASIAYGWYGIFSVIVSTTVNGIFVVLPSVTNAGAGPQQAAAIGGAVGLVLGLVFGTIYPGLLLFFMYRPNVKAWFANGGAAMK